MEFHKLFLFEQGFINNVSYLGNHLEVLGEPSEGPGSTASPGNSCSFLIPDWKNPKGKPGRATPHFNMSQTGFPVVILHQYWASVHFGWAVDIIVTPAVAYLLALIVLDCRLYNFLTDRCMSSQLTPLNYSWSLYIQLTRFSTYWLGSCQYFGPCWELRGRVNT